MSQNLKEKITEADVLRYGFEGNLKLSVEFVNYTSGYIGELLSGEDSQGADGDDGEGLSIISICENDETKDDENKQYLRFKEEAVEISEIWDLSMMGNEYYDVKNRYYSLVGRQVLIRDIAMGYSWKKKVVVFLYY